MSINRKTLLIILIIFLVLVVMFLIIFNFLTKKEISSQPDSSETTSMPTSQPASRPIGSSSQTDQPPSSLISSQIKAISQEAVLDPVVDGRKIKYYSANNGTVSQVNFDGTDLTRISTNILTGLLKVLWGPARDQVIAIFEDQGQARKYLYNYQTQKSTLLNKNIRYIAWSPDQNKIAYQYYDLSSEANNISVAAPDGSNWENVLTTRMKNLIVEWPNPEQVSIRTRPSGLAQSVVYTINLPDGDFEKIIKETYGLTLLWSPLGDKILFSETNSQGKNLKLKIADLGDGTIKELNLITLPEKCVWSQDNRTLFCAIPQEIPSLMVLPDDYYKGQFNFNDQFWRINLDTGEITQLFSSLGQGKPNYDAYRLLLSPQEDYLVFVNKKDGFLYSLAL